MAEQLNPGEEQQSVNDAGIKQNNDGVKQNINGVKRNLCVLNSNVDSVCQTWVVPNETWVT